MTSMLASYERQVTAGELEADAAQLGAAGRLDRLAQALRSWQRRRSGLLGIFDGRLNGAPKGLYLHGGVGRGKTMLMDLFFDHVSFEPKRRIHFHEFMAETHDLIAEARARLDGDPLPYVAERIAARARLLCFDELHVTDIADAMILGRLFKLLFEDGVRVVATSNFMPSELYKDGLNRPLFVPFIALIEQHMEVVELAAAKDFRLDKLAGRQLYFTPDDAAARAGLDRHWQRLTGGSGGKPATLEVKGRAVAVPKAAMGVARFHFSELCDRPLGTGDYLAIAHAFHTVLIDSLPVLINAPRDVTRRFINMIDTFYDSRICLIASAAAEPDDLYADGRDAELFRRTASRLIEMRSEAYLEERGRRSGSRLDASCSSRAAIR